MYLPRANKLNGVGGAKTDLMMYEEGRAVSRAMGKPKPK